MIEDAVTAEQTPRPDFTINQVWDRYTPDEHAVWRELYDRQIRVLDGRCVDAFYDGLDRLDLNQGGIPDLRRLNPALKALTGWEVVCVPHLVPDAVFFDHLAGRRFPAGRFIRSRNRMDYIQEPDIFHDVFGHVPLLAQPVFADYMQAYGEGGLRALKKGRLKNLARLYWYTVEFGLMQTPEGLRIYGAGISSSCEESIFALDSPSPNRIDFDLMRVMQTEYRIDDFQQTYFVTRDFDQLLQLAKTDFASLYDHLDMAEHIFGVADIQPDDTVITHGSQSYHTSGSETA